MHAGGWGEVQGEISGQNFANEPNKLMMRDRDKSMRKEVGRRMYVIGRKKTKSFFFRT